MVPLRKRERWMTGRWRSEIVTQDFISKKKIGMNILHIIFFCTFAPFYVKNCGQIE